MFTRVARPAQPLLRNMRVGQAAAAQLRAPTVAGRVRADKVTHQSCAQGGISPLTGSGAMFHSSAICQKSNSYAESTHHTQVSHLLPEFNLRDKVILVSGGAQGLGLLQAEALLEAGAIVHILDRQPEPGADAGEYARIRARAISEFSRPLTYHQVNVRTEVDKLNEIAYYIAESSGGRLDGLLAAAGIQRECPAIEYTADDSDAILGVNVTGVLMTAQAVARQMKRLDRPGSLCLIASMSGTVANRGLICPMYNASKAGVIQLARNLASEWGQFGIRVNTISPGYIETDMVRALFKKHPERQIEWPRQNMLNRISRAEDYRGAAVFLLSDASSFMTGADMRIDGGHAAW